ncbi:hypothetical protein GIB67_027729 [Kingdonia uniflora]|uniref:Uncharacterized protein n=1 Tax=Kingdonia uniflora TaxID=39325 RepID=A0A7J7PBX9_9MAGN|nr:hypothetical protein GIB67_027729 [Kingdonia uniflora]
MASACVNNIGVLSENFSSSYSPSFGWFSPRVSFSHEIPKEEEGLKIETSIENPIDGSSKGFEDLIDLSGGNDVGDFEFRLDYPVPMLPADELFSNGKLIIPSVQIPIRPFVGLGSREEMRESFRRQVSDPYLFSPKAPRCSSRWKELLGLKKVFARFMDRRSQALFLGSVSCFRLLRRKMGLLLQSEAAPSVAEIIGVIGFDYEGFFYDSCCCVAVIIVRVIMQCLLAITLFTSFSIVDSDQWVKQCALLAFYEFLEGGGVEL